MSTPSQTILLIDDEQGKLDDLARCVREKASSVDVRTWRPSENEDPSEAFALQADGELALVVTDYDLTKAVKGLFGHSVVAWCRKRLIPVGDFSRGHPTELSMEPDLFKLRVPSDEAAAAAYIVSLFRGFGQIAEGIEQSPELLSEGTSPAQVLAAVLGRERSESQLSPYLSRPELFNPSLLDTLRSNEPWRESENLIEKTRLLTYILSHVLVNAVLKYPGPILAEAPLCAYLAVSSEDIDEVAGLFEESRYTGPFGDSERLFWREDVDEVVETLAQQFEIDDAEYSSFGDYHRAVISKAVPRPLAKHDCERCDGDKGGFWCPFTKRAVCERNDCFSPASSWIPAGAYACRVEKDFFDLRSPILGL